MASATSVYKEVRKNWLNYSRSLQQIKMLSWMEEISEPVWLPNAQVKIYLTASVETRAERRYQELLEKGAACDLEVIKKILRTVIIRICIGRFHH